MMAIIAKRLIQGERCSFSGSKVETGKAGPGEKTPRVLVFRFKRDE